MQRNLKKGIAALTILILIFGACLADEVRLKNGDQLRGKIVTMESGKLIFNTSYLSYVNNDFDEGEDDRYPAGRWSINFDRFLLDKFVQFFHFDEGLVSLEDTNDVLVRTKTGLRFPLYRSFKLTAQYELNWDNTPPARQGKSDHRYIFSLGYMYLN